MIKSIAHFLRYTIGSFFIFSGFVKAIDPIGTAIKMEEYFTVFTEYFPALTSFWEFWADMSLPLSIFMIALEMILGVALLVGVYFNLSVLLVFGMLLFFTFLTGFTLYTGKVTDCGCFGDFMKLKPVETFGKDVVLTILTAILWFLRGHLTKIKGSSLNLFLGLVLLITLWVLWFFSYGISGSLVIIGLIAFSALMYSYINSVGIKTSVAFIAFCLGSIFFTGFTFRNVMNLPIVDFRAYKIGTDLRDCTSTEGLDMGETVSKFVMAKGDEEKTVGLKEYSALLKEGWEYRDRIDVVIREAEEPKCKDFRIIDDEGGEWQEDLVLEAQGVTLIVSSYDIDKGDAEGFAEIANLVKQTKAKGAKAIGLTGSKITAANALANNAYQYYNLDAVPIKTMNRSNPGLTVVKNGVLVGKYHYNYLPTVDELMQLKK